MTPMTPDEFRLHHSGKIREALIMIEGYDGSFELLTHGVMLLADRQDAVPYATLRSTNSSGVHLLVRDAVPALPPWRHWHEIAADELPSYQAVV
jgi:hypothetical protein